MWHIYCSNANTQSLKSEIKNQEQNSGTILWITVALIFNKDKQDVKQFVLGFYIVNGGFVGGYEHLWHASPRTAGWWCGKSSGIWWSRQKLNAPIGVVFGFSGTIHDYFGIVVVCLLSLFSTLNVIMSFNCSGLNDVALMIYQKWNSWLGSCQWSVQNTVLV